MFSEDKTSYKFDVLLAYNRQDKEDVLYFYEELVRRGLKPWMDVKEIWGGETWPVAIDRGIKDSKTAVFFISDKGIGNWQKSELMIIYMAYVNMGMPPHGPIPILLSPIMEIPGDFEKLKPFNAIQFQKIDDPVAMDHLEASISRLPASFRRTSPYGIFVKVPKPSKSFFISTPEQGAEDIFQALAKVLSKIQGIEIVVSNQIAGDISSQEKLMENVRSSEVVIAICNNKEYSSKQDLNTIYALGMATSLGKSVILITDDKEAWMKNSLFCTNEDKVLEYKKLDIDFPGKFSEDFENMVKKILDKIQPPFLIEKDLDDVKIRYWDDVRCTYPVFISDFFTIVDFVEDIYYYFPDIYNETKQMVEMVKEIEEALDSLSPNSSLTVNTRIESFARKWIEYTHFFDQVKESFFGTVEKYQIDIDQAFESFIREANTDMKTALEPARDNYRILKERLLSYVDFHDDIVIKFLQQNKSDKEILVQEKEQSKQNIRNILRSRNKVTSIKGALSAYMDGTAAIVQKTHEIMIKLLQVIEHRSGRNELRKYFPRNQKET
jgi:hypothetical protein